ncbi:MAG: polysaccharide export protein [Candidatus Omnitrophica bacterium]|nr:polysaccharide export protein [Candidatus Omnitrophota bacterium]MDD5311206.1 polysaccharide export protein [Candidatus Omnitrophota bacterium]MDD5546127.1 polysaccharide export protein [Candidatus Omnitrophota bacterium]
MKGLTIVISLAAVCVFLPRADADEAAKKFNFAQPKAAAPGVKPQAPESSMQETAPLTAAPAPLGAPAPKSSDYRVGNEDILDIAVLQPEQLALTVTVSPDGSITFPYIGKVDVKGKTPSEVQDEIQARLADGYLKYPVVSVAVKESRSKKFYVYGEVLKPGTYFLEDNMTVLKAISSAGGFTKYGSSSRVKVLRPKAGSAGYETIKANMKLIMNGLSKDIVLEPGDIVQVEEGVF